jgi:hypothetical protein
MQALGMRALLLMVLGVAAVPVVAVGVAYGCTALATANTSTSTATPGTTITVSGKGFSPHDPSDARTAPAVIRLDRVDGPALATATPSSSATGGAFAVDVTVPDVEAGPHVLVVTQDGIDGRPAYGTPARAVLMVEPRPAPPAPPVAPAPPPPPPALAVVPPPAPPAAAPKRTTLAQRIAACKRKHKLSTAKTKRGRARIAARRAACIRSARRNAS